MYFFEVFRFFFQHRNEQFCNMKYSRPVVLFLVLGFLFSGCSLLECEHDQPITEGLDQWVPYQTNDAEHFRTAALLDEYVDVTLFERGWENADTDCTDDIEYIQAYITARNSFADSLSLRISNNNVQIAYGLNLNMTYIEGSPGYSTSTSSLTFHESMNVGGQTLSNVIVVSCDNCDGLTNIKLSKTFGVVEYTYDALTYTRMF
jgi:hypothetical protein